MSRALRLVLLVLTSAACVDEVVPLPGLTRPDGGAGLGDGASEPVDAASVGDAAVTLDASVPDAPEPVTDDCAPGSWCWERPIPSGETVAVAKAFSGDRAVTISQGGTLATWDGGEWRLRLLDLAGATPVSLWAESPEVLYVLVRWESVDARSLYRVRGGRAELLAQGRGAAYELVGPSENELYSAAGDQVLRWDGRTWTAFAGPRPNAFLTALRWSSDGLQALESWGSGSGFGILHRFVDGGWQVEFDFRAVGSRVDGPIVEADGAQWLRAFDFDRGRTSVARGEGGRWTLVRVPVEFGDIRQVGDQVWFVSGDRAWVREGSAWTGVADFPGTQYAPLTGFGTQAWAFGGRYASREPDGGWRTWGEAPRPTLGFWRTGDERLALATVSPISFAVNPRAAERGPWTDQPFEVDGEVFAFDNPVDGTGILALPTGLAFVRGVRLENFIPIPRSLRGFGVVARGPGASAWMGLADGRLARWAPSWSQPIDAPRFDGFPDAVPTLLALHVTDEGTLYAGVRVITGDKQVWEGVFVREAEAWRALVSQLGEFGRDRPILIAGRSDGDLWVSLGGVWRGDRTFMERRLSLDLVDLELEADGIAVGLGPDGIVYDFSNGPGRPNTLPNPLGGSVYFHRVHRTETGLVRLTTPAGQVLRYTPIR